MIDAHGAEDACQHPAPRAIHAVDGVFLPGGGDARQVGEEGDGLDIRAEKIDLGNRGPGRGHRQSLPQVTLDHGHDGGAAGSAIAGFILYPVPIVRIMAGGDHHPAGRAPMLHRVGERRGRGDAIGQVDGDAGAGSDFRHHVGEAL